MMGELGVFIFFQLSGYCIASAAVRARSRPAPVRNFSRARAKRLYPPYVIATVLAMGMAALCGILAERGVLPPTAFGSMRMLEQDIWYFVANFTITQNLLSRPFTLAVFWSLTFEVAFYAIVATFLAITRRARDETALLNSLHAVTFISLAWMILSQNTCPFPLGGWPYFGLGVSLFHVTHQPTGQYPRVILFAAVVLLLCIPSLPGEELIRGAPTNALRRSFSAAFVGVLLALYRFDPALSRWRVIRAFAWVGTFSYSLYLSHLLVVGPVYAVTRRLGVTEQTYVISFGLQILAAIAFARVFFFVAERPFLNSTALRSASCAPVQSALPACVSPTDSTRPVLT
jgi:peptidoglycan/LPS O-acetylase OafA/YrhL